MRRGYWACALLAAGCAASSALAGGSSLGLYIPFDSNNTAGWTQSMPRNDDGSTENIQLPFEFCFYDTPRNSLYINNNGNVSFSGPFASFTSTGFPVGGFDMIAPFWADVDTRNGAVGAEPTNLVWHQFLDLSAGVAGLDTLVVTWDAVGYYSAAGGNNSHRNTFQLLMSADNNLFGASRNTLFAYGDMNWTTGQASGGDADGLGGTPATVGINLGDGATYSQLGRFDHRGGDYDGGGGAVDGVDYLDGRWVAVDACVPEPGTLSLLALGALALVRRRS